MAAALFLFFAAILRVWITPAIELLPPKYAAEIDYVAKLKTRQGPSSMVEESETIVRRRDQTLIGGLTHLIVQGDAHWITDSGKVLFETLNIYGVDRRTRQNLSGYGDMDRRGQFLFPPHTEQKQYVVWDPNYLGPNLATFDRKEPLGGIKVFVFKYVAEGVDDTAGFEALPGVPERYRALSYGRGEFWVEPESGMTIDHWDRGASHFADPDSGKQIGEPLMEWDQRYTPRTVQAQLDRAIAMRRQTRLTGMWLPGGSAAAAVCCFFIGWLQRQGGMAS